MANPTLWILLLGTLIFQIDGSISSDHTSGCVPVCKDGVCPVKIEPIDVEECHCRRMFARTGKRKKQKLNMTISPDSVEITLPVGLKTGGKAMLFVGSAREDVKPICYNLGKLKGKSSETSRIKLKCARLDGISFNETIILNKNKKLIVGKLDSPKVPQKWEGPCSCWSPRNVMIKLIGNNTLEVGWDPFFGHRDVQVMVEEKNSKRMRDEMKLKNYQLCGQRLQHITFTDYEPGTYVAMVGAVGCECKGESDPIKIDRLYVQKPELKPILVPKKEPEVNLTIVLGVVGALAFLSVFALGLSLIIRQRRQNYTLVSRPNEEFRLATFEGDYQREPSDDGRELQVLEQISTPLKVIFQESNVRVTTRPMRRPYEENELELYVSLKDANNTPMYSSQSNKRRLEVLMIHTEDDSHDLPLVVSIPPGCPHPAFRVHDGQGSTLNLRRVIQKLNPEFDFDAGDFEDFGNSVKEMEKEMKDDIQNILLISGNGHEFHVNACKELCKILRTIGKTVNYVLEDDNRVELREEGPYTWMDTHLQNPDLVIVVASEYLHKLVDRYTRREDCVELSGYLGSCESFALTQMSRRSRRSRRFRVAFVSFGYESEFIESIEKISGVNCTMRYDLVRTSGVIGQGRHWALKVFLSRLSSNHSLVQRACEQSDMFHRNVDSMKEFLINHQDWLSESSSTSSLSGRVGMEIETCV